MYIKLFNSQSSLFSINELITISDTDVFLVEIQNANVLGNDTARFIIDDCELARSLAIKTQKGFTTLSEEEKLQLSAQLEKNDFLMF